MSEVLRGKAKFTIDTGRLKSYRERLYPFMTKEEIAVTLNPDSKDSPFYGYVGNRPAIDTFGDILYSGFLNPAITCNDKSNHAVGPLSVSFIGPPSVGKTELARRGAAALSLPFIECDRSIKNAESLLDVLEGTCQKWGVDLVGSSSTPARILSPPAVIFFDEAQELRGDWLLKATEANDAILITKDAIVDVRQILWIFCTTHRGKLSPAFDSRTQKVFLQPYTRQQVAQILEFKFPKFDEATRLSLAGYGRCIPRECINFAQQVERAAERSGISYPEACEQIAQRNGVDAEGLNAQHLGVLVALKNDAVSHKHLADQIRVAPEDLENYVLPPILIQLPDRPPLVSVSSRGYELTSAGKEALQQRNL